MSNPLNFWVLSSAGRPWALAFKSSEHTADSVKHKAIQKSAEAGFVMVLVFLFAATAAVRRSCVSLTQPGSVSVNGDCNADTLRRNRKKSSGCRWWRRVRVCPACPRFTVTLGNCLNPSIFWGVSQTWSSFLSTAGSWLFHPILI